MQRVVTIIWANFGGDFYLGENCVNASGKGYYSNVGISIVQELRIMKCF
ncbi:1303_t:CDS:1, partial [Gigaspora rosea]